MNRYVFWLGCFLVATAHLSDRQHAGAADLEMVDAFGNVTGVVDVSRRGISVFENNGDRWFYRRERRYDLPGGRYLGFYNLELNRAIRFPIDGRGPIQRADLDLPYPRFVPATVTVRPIGSSAVFGPYLEYWQYGGLAVSGTGLSVGPIGGYAPIAPRLPVPAIPSYGVAPGSGGSSGYQPYLPPTNLPSVVPPIFATPRSMLLESRVVANPPLPPVEVALTNSGGDTLHVSIVDATNPTQPANYQIAGGAVQRVKLPRDAGQTRVRVFQTYDATGQPIQQEVRDAIPPEPRFQVTVRRIQIQSIAIDRTGKSPSPIEDVNMQGIGIGRFWLPPGDLLRSGPIDLLNEARAAGNRGTIAPIDAN